VFHDFLHKHINLEFKFNTRKDLNT